jgi:hypothetical protein
MKERLEGLAGRAGGMHMIAQSTRSERDNSRNLD